MQACRRSICVVLTDLGADVDTVYRREPQVPRDQAIILPFESGTSEVWEDAPRLVAVRDWLRALLGWARETGRLQ